jgi:hypothetical protein
MLSESNEARKREAGLKGETMSIVVSNDRRPLRPPGERRDFKGALIDAIRHPAPPPSAPRAAPGGAALHVRVLRYNACTRAAVQGFADVEIDGKWRLNGLNVMRDGSLKAGQLTPLIHGRRTYIPSVEVTDPDLRDSLTAAILAAIQAHLQSLPTDERVLPPRPLEPRKTDQRPQAAPANGKPLPAKPQPTATLAQIARAKAKPVPVPPASARPPALPPPVRLLANFPRRTL